MQKNACKNLIMQKYANLLKQSLKGRRMNFDVIILKKLKPNLIDSV